MTSRPASTNVPAARSGPRGNRRRAAAAIVALLAVLSGAVVSTAAAAQEDNTAGDSTIVRIVARKLDSGRIEFGLQQRQPDNAWGDRQRPRVRFFPTTATVGNWLASSTLDLPAGEVRIVARKLDDGRIEFGLQQRQPDNAWGDRQRPRVRFFPTTATVNRWLASSPLTLTTPQPAPQPARRIHRPVLRRHRRRGSIRARCAPTAPSPAGATTARGRRPRRSGQFSAVTAGGAYSCGLRTDGTITCWGYTTAGGAGDRARRAILRRHRRLFPFVRAAHRRHHHLLGRQRRGEGTAPDGQYSAVTASFNYSCGLRTDGTITCWGANTYGQATAPDGQYSAVTAGPNHSCGLRTNGTITCSGHNGVGQATAPDGQYSAVSVGWGHSCGLRTNGTITCWGSNFYGQATPPDGQYSAVTAAGERHSCGLRTNGTITCWGDNDEGQATVPDG